MTHKYSYGSIGMAAVVLFAVALLVWQRYQAIPEGPSFPPELSTITLPNPKSLKPFALTDQEGKPFTLAQLEGQWTFLFFGYTHCPDVCPMAMGMLGEVFHRMKEGQSPSLATTQGVLVTVDPKRDTPSILKQYVTYFNPGFKGLTGSEEEIKLFTKQMGAIYFLASEFKDEGKEGAPAPSGKEPDGISHTSAFFLMDPLGRLVAIFPEYNNTDMILEEYEKIRKFVRIRQIYANPEHNR